ncbi:MAG: hypothetical protein K2X53_02095 [Alphaproteobacteria bacterium]|nr:hypothetical protein [Alphaproteobacteria bacterium]
MRLYYTLILSSLTLSVFSLSAAEAETGRLSVSDHIKNFETMTKPQQAQTVKIEFKDTNDLMRKVKERSMYRVVFGQDLSHLKNRIDMPSSIKRDEQEVSGVELKQMIKDVPKSGITFFSVERIVK